MSDGALSQDEIDALLAGADDFSPAAAERVERNGLNYISDEIYRLMKSANNDWLFGERKEKNSSDLSTLAACYALPEQKKNLIDQILPSTSWDRLHFQSIDDDRIRELSRAGALIVIEIDKLVKEKEAKEKEVKQKQTPMSEKGILLKMLSVIEKLSSRIEALDNRVSELGG